MPNERVRHDGVNSASMDVGASAVTRNPSHRDQVRIAIQAVTLNYSLVSCPRSKVPFRPLIFPDDRVGPFGPDERFRGGIAVIEVAADR